MTTPAAGWFPDPAGRTDSYRWWDGATWTRYLTADPALPGPSETATEQPAAEVEAAPDSETARTTIAEETRPRPAQTRTTARSEPTQQESADAAADAAATEPIRSGTRRGRAPRPMPPGYDLGRPARRGPVALLVPIVIAIAAGALAVVIAVHARSQSDELLSPPQAVPSSAQRIALDFDDATGIVTMPSLQVTMPKAPFISDHSDFDIYGVFSDSVQAEATVQRYGKNRSWIAVVDAGVLQDKLVGEDLETTAKNTFNAVVKGGFGPGANVTIKNLHSTALKDMPDKVWIVNGDVHYKVKGVHSTFDRVNVMIVDVGSGRYVGWLSDRPNKSKPAVKKAIDASIKTIKLTS